MDATIPRLSNVSASLSKPALISNTRTIWIADARRGDGKRFVARAAEKLTTFIELERVTRESLRFLNAD